MSWHRNDPRQMTTLILREDGSSLVRAAGATDAELDLMIAAPELREALKALMLHGHRIDVMKDASDALAKAGVK